MTNYLEVDDQLTTVIIPSDTIVDQMPPAIQI